MASNNKKIISKRIPFWALPVRAIYRLFVTTKSKSNTLRQVERGGIKYLIWTGEDVGKKILYLRRYESDETEFFNKVIKPGDICLDIGGNIGYYSINFSRFSSSSGKVYVFEPVERNELVIRLACKLNNLNNIEVIRSAVSDCNGDVLLNIPENDSAYAYLADNSGLGSVSVSCITLDKFIATKNIKKVSVLKIDVEGAEYKVLKGAKALLSDLEARPNVVMVELASHYLERFQATVSQVIEYMSSFGYEPYYATRNGKLLPFTNADVDTIYNVFFIANINDIDN